LITTTTTQNIESQTVTHKLTERLDL